jgi:hypothetical protein
MACRPGASCATTTSSAGGGSACVQRTIVGNDRRSITSAARDAGLPRPLRTSTATARVQTACTGCAGRAALLRQINARRARSAAAWAPTVSRATRSVRCTTRRTPAAPCAVRVSARRRTSTTATRAVRSEGCSACGATRPWGCWVTTLTDAERLPPTWSEPGEAALPRSFGALPSALARARSSVGRALRSHRRGRWFNPSRAHHVGRQRPACAAPARARRSATPSSSES